MGIVNFLIPSDLFVYFFLFTLPPPLFQISLYKVGEGEIAQKNDIMESRARRKYSRKVGGVIDQRGTPPPHPHPAARRKPLGLPFSSRTRRKKINGWRQNKKKDVFLDKNQRCRLVKTRKEKKKTESLGVDRKLMLIID